jgi:hypothetical protein
MFTANQLKWLTIHQTLETYENLVPKDVVALHPGARLKVLAR